MIRLIDAAEFQRLRRIKQLSEDGLGARADEAAL